MGLPPALAARLKKRGIIKEKTQHEEVFAENYDTQVIYDNLHDEFGNKLPPKWEKIFEQKFCTWYYWDTVTNRVSWLPPSDPEHKLTFSENKTKSIESMPTTRDKFKEPRDKVQKKSKKRKIEEDEFDPMDPSSYSDAPRGGWGVGLKKIDDAKSGVDSTANGVLFQQRPYPSPGEVLSRNRKARNETGPQRPK